MSDNLNEKMNESLTPNEAPLEQLEALVNDILVEANGEEEEGVTVEAGDLLEGETGSSGEAKPSVKETALIEKIDSTETVTVLEDSPELNQTAPLGSQTSNDQASIVSGVTKMTFNNLTKKNQQYLISVEKHFADNEHTSTLRAVFNEIAETLIAGQKTGQTAKQLYGTPSECAGIIRAQHLPKEDAVNSEPSSSALLTLDGSLLLGSIYTLITGISLLNNQESEIRGLGLLTILVNYLVAGFAMNLISKNLPKPDAPKGEKGYFKYFGMSTLAMISWVAAVSFVTAFAPTAINPILPPIALVFIGLITFGLRFYFKKKYNIRGGIF